MKKILFAAAFLFIASLAVSCKTDKDGDDKIDTQALWDCNAAQNLDSAKTAAKLIGHWDWVEQSCYWGNKTTKADKNVKAVFSPSGLFSVNENDSTIEKGTWRLEPGAIDGFKLKLEPGSAYLAGIVVVCDGNLLLYESYIDGCDRLFKRID